MRELSLSLLLFKSLQVKIIFMSKRLILGKRGCEMAPLGYLLPKLEDQEGVGLLLIGL